MQPNSLVEIPNERMAGFSEYRLGGKVVGYGSSGMSLKEVLEASAQQAGQGNGAAGHS